MRSQMRTGAALVSAKGNWNWQGCLQKVLLEFSSLTTSTLPFGVKKSLLFMNKALQLTLEHELCRSATMLFGSFSILD